MWRVITSDTTTEFDTKELALNHIHNNSITDWRLEAYSDMASEWQYVAGKQTI